MNGVRELVRYSLAMFLASMSIGVAAQVGEAVCGDPFQNAYGPFDYRTASAKVRRLVEDHHFTPKVESLRGGNTTAHPVGDLEYTLNVFPNHHRALMSMMKLSLREKSNRPGGASMSIECRFDRAERFRPDDAMVKVIIGLYLFQSGRSTVAVAKFEQARELDSNNPNVHYNLGLAYFNLQKYDLSLESAHIAYAQGFPLPGLRDKLKRAGKWRDPVAAPSEIAAPDVHSEPQEGAPEAVLPEPASPETAPESLR